MSTTLTNAAENADTAANASGSCIGRSGGSGNVHSHDASSVQQAASVKSSSSSSSKKSSQPQAAVSKNIDLKTKSTSATSSKVSSSGKSNPASSTLVNGSSNGAGVLCNQISPHKVQRLVYSNPGDPAQSQTSLLKRTLSNSLLDLNSNKLCELPRPFWF